MRRPISARQAFWTVFGATLAVYLLSTSYVFDSGDGITEITYTGEPGWHLRSYHLFQTASNKLAMALATAFGHRASALVPVHVLNSFCGAASSALLFRLLRRCDIGQAWALFATAVWTLSAAVWAHSVTGETGVTCMPFVIGAVLLVVPETPAPPRAALLRVVAASALLAAAATLSLNVALVFPGLLVGAWRMGENREQQRRLVLAMFGALALFGGAPFVIVAAKLGHTTPGSFVHWLATHPESRGLSHRGFGQVLRAATGISRLVFPPAEGETAIKAMLQHQQVKIGMTGWIQLARNVVAALVLVLLATRAAWRDRKRSLTVLHVAAAAPTAIFSVFWLGSDPQFWLPIYPFLLVLAAQAGEDLVWPRALAGEWPRRIGAAAILVGLFLTGYVQEGPSLLAPHGGAGWASAEHAAGVFAPGDLLLGPGNSPLTWATYMQPGLQVYDLTYSPGELAPREELLGVVEHKIRSTLASGKRVYVYGLSDPIRPTMVGYWQLTEGKHGVSRDQFASFIDRSFARTIDTAVGDDVHQVTTAP